MKPGNSLLAVARLAQGAAKQFGINQRHTRCGSSEVTGKANRSVLSRRLLLPSAKFQCYDLAVPGQLHLDQVFGSIRYRQSETLGPPDPVGICQGCRFRVGSVDSANFRLGFSISQFLTSPALDRALPTMKVSFARGQMIFSDLTGAVAQHGQGI
jgi:hypothetical protein